MSLLRRFGKSFGAIKEKISATLSENNLAERILENISISIERNCIVDEQTINELYREINKYGRNTIQKLKIAI